jgi:hypothetical protein
MLGRRNVIHRSNGKSRGKREIRLLHRGRAQQERLSLGLRLEKVARWTRIRPETLAKIVVKEDAVGNEAGRESAQMIIGVYGSLHC